MKYNEIERLQQLAGIITEIKVNKPTSYITTIKRVINDPAYEIEMDDGHMGKAEIVWHYLTQDYPETQNVSEEEWDSINNMILKELEKINEIKVNNPHQRYKLNSGDEQEIKIWIRSVRPEEYRDEILKSLRTQSMGYLIDEYNGTWSLISFIDEKIGKPEKEKYWWTDDEIEEIK